MAEELPDDIRVPLHSLQADMRWLFGRVANDPDAVGIVTDSVLERLSEIEAAVKKMREAS
jgi:hypothetical protein